MIIVTAAIINDDNKYLIAQRAINDKLPLKWEFPGGKVEADETPEDSLKREINEELNLAISVGELFAISKSKNNDEITLMAYKAIILGGDLELRVHNDARWVSISHLNKYDFCPADIEIVEKISGKV